MTNTSPELASWWHPVGRVAELADAPMRVWLLGEAWVVARTGDGLIAMIDRCPHRRTPLSAGRIVDGQLECPYHGWRFGGDGRCKLIPALGAEARTPSAAHVRNAWGVLERHGLIWLAPEQPIAPIIELPDWDAATRRRVDMDVFSGRFGAALLIDNQLDLGHFPFVHASTFGSPGGKVVPAVEIEREPWGFTGRGRVPIIAANDPGVLTGEREVTQHRDMVYRYRAPFSLELRLDYPSMGGSMIVMFFAQPEAEDRCKFYVTLSFEHPDGLDDQALAERVKFEYEVVAEDMDLQAVFDDIRMPLAPGAELHTRADKMSIEYRRILVDLLGPQRSAD